MSTFPKPHRERLEGDEYKELIRSIYERDRWMCRCCGSKKSLTPHHCQKRSQLGSDTMGNVITLCIGCHNEVEANRLKVEVVDVVVVFKE